MTARMIDAGDYGNWVDADEWAIECNDNDDTISSAIGGQLWPRLAEGKRRDG